MRDDINIHQFVEKILTDQECQALIEIYNRNSGCNHISIGLLPFITHSVIMNILKECKRSDLTGQFQTQYTQIYYPDNLSNIDTLIDKLNADSYWVDITSVMDPYRLEYNTITEEYRTTPYEPDTKFF